MGNIKLNLRFSLPDEIIIHSIELRFRSLFFRGGNCGGGDDGGGGTLVFHFRQTVIQLVVTKENDNIQMRSITGISCERIGSKNIAKIAIINFLSSVTQIQT